MRNKLRSTAERLMRMVVQADKGYYHLKLNYHNVEDNVTIMHEDLNTWKTKTLHVKLSDSTGKPGEQRILLIVAFRRLYPP
jgi:hypothetical protein